MRHMTPHVRITILAAALLLGVVGCGGGEPPPAPGPTPTATPTSVATAAADGVQEATPPPPDVATTTPSDCILAKDLAEADVGKPYRSWTLRSRLSHTEMRFPPDRALELSSPDPDTGFVAWDVVSYCFEPPNA